MLKIIAGGLLWGKDRQTDGRTDNTVECSITVENKQQQRQQQQQQPENLKTFQMQKVQGNRTVNRNTSTRFCFKENNSQPKRIAFVVTRSDRLLNIRRRPSRPDQKSNTKPFQVYLRACVSITPSNFVSSFVKGTLEDFKFLDHSLEIIENLPLEWDDKQRFNSSFAF
uniref:Uncharacterized protein n=1 Tax=Glossina austeni TaxID=7395 RepID=A0A1A9UF90_GLOAU